MYKEINVVTKEELFFIHRHIHHKLRERFGKEPVAEYEVKKWLGGMFRLSKEDIATELKLYIRLGWLQRTGMIGHCIAYIVR